MRILKLHHPQGHPYWSQGEYEVEMPDGSFLKPDEFINQLAGGFEIFVKAGDIFIQSCASGSGYGKMRIGFPVLMVSKYQYDSLIYVGKANSISDTLAEELKRFKYL